MKINDLVIPADLSRLKEFKDKEVRTLQDSDSYGFLLECEIVESFYTEKAIARAHRALVEKFTSKDRKWTTSDGVILWHISDLSKVIPFARDSSGYYFCFDFRQSNSDPSILYWDATVQGWRQIADDFTSFFELFDWDNPVVFDEE